MDFNLNDVKIDGFTDTITPDYYWYALEAKEIELLGK